ncbi:hypothetical protein [Burkholderia ubonensis]|nr:hypothetical protein [Burkholderia ubonensis]
MKAIFNVLLLTSPIFALTHFFGFDIRQLFGRVLDYFANLLYYYFGWWH